MTILGEREQSACLDIDTSNQPLTDKRGASLALYSATTGQP